MVFGLYCEFWDLHPVGKNPLGFKWCSMETSCLRTMIMIMIMMMTTTTAMVKSTIKETTTAKTTSTKRTTSKTITIFTFFGIGEVFNFFIVNFAVILTVCKIISFF